MTSTLESETEDDDHRSQKIVSSVNQSNRRNRRLKQTQPPPSIKTKNIPQLTLAQGSGVWMNIEVESNNSQSIVSVLY